MVIKWIRKHCSIIMVCSAALITFTIIMYLVSKTDFMEGSNSIVTFIGFVLGFISILLSAVAIFETCKVQKQVALHDYKIKQQETVAHLVNQINTYVFLADFRKNGESDTTNSMFHRINIVGINVLEVTKYGKYGDLPVLISDSFYFKPASEFVGSAYLPHTIAINLQKFMRQYPQKEITEIQNEKSYVLIRTGQYNESNKYIQQGRGIYARWGDFSTAIDELLQSITTWYKEADIHIEPNFICTDIVSESF